MALVDEMGIKDQTREDRGIVETIGKSRGTRKCCIAS